MADDLIAASTLDPRDEAEAPSVEKDAEDAGLDELERMLERLRARQEARADKAREAAVAREQAKVDQAMRPESIAARKAAREQARAKAEAAARAPLRVRFGGLARRGLYVDHDMTVVVPEAASFTVEADQRDERFVTITATRPDLLELAVALRARGEPGRRAAKCIQAALGRLGPAQLRTAGPSRARPELEKFRAKREAREQARASAQDESRG